MFDAARAVRSRVAVSILVAVPEVGLPTVRRLPANTDGFIVKVPPPVKARLVTSAVEALMPTETLPVTSMEPATLTLLAVGLLKLATRPVKVVLLPAKSIVPPLSVNGPAKLLPPGRRRVPAPALPKPVTPV